MTKKEKTRADAMIERTYRRACMGIEIDIMDIGKVFQAGYAAIQAGADEAGLERAILETVTTLRQN